MMKRSLALALTLASGMVLSAAAQSPAPAAAPAGPTKIAVIEFQAAVAQTNEFQRNFGDLQKKWDPKRQQLKTLSDEVDGLDQGAAKPRDHRSRSRIQDDFAGYQEETIGARY